MLSDILFTFLEVNFAEGQKTLFSYNDTISKYLLARVLIIYHWHRPLPPPPPSPGVYIYFVKATAKEKHEPNMKRC